MNVSEGQEEQEIVAHVCEVLATRPTVQQVRDYFGFTTPRASRRRLPRGWAVTLVLTPPQRADARIMLVAPSGRRVRFRVRVDAVRWPLGPWCLLAGQRPG